MTRGSALGLLLAALALTATGCGEPPVPKNVILVTIDTLRADHVGAYGSDKGLTPTLDALAAEGAVFDNASTTIPLTGPAHSSILTGRYPIVTGFRNNGTALLSPEETLISEVLHDHGMRTAAVVSCLVLASHFGFNQGFDLYYESDITSKKGRGMWYEERKADKTVDRTLRWIESEQGRPMFVWMHLFDPHHPYDPPGVDMTLPLERRYELEIAFADKQLGRFFDELKKMGMWDDTMIIVSGDHGESLGEHHEQFHGIFVYQATMHVPLIVRLPGAKRGIHVSDQASVLDIFPTVLDALHLPLPDNIQGFSLTKSLTGRGRIPARTPYLESIYANASYGWAEVSAIRTPHWKYISLPSPELYDMDSDPNESVNLVNRDTAQAEEVRGELTDLRGRLESLQRTDNEAVALDDEMRDRLLSLGYIAGTESKLRKGEPRDPKEVVDLGEKVTLVSRDDAQSPASTRPRRRCTRCWTATRRTRWRCCSYARLLATTKRVDEAVATMHKAIDIYPDSEELYRVLGMILIRNDRKEEAIALFSKGLEVMPSSASLIYMYGYANFRADKWRKAIEALEESLKLNPAVPKAYYLLGLCHEKLHERDAAYASFEKYLGMEPDVESLFKDPYLEDFRKDPRFAALVKRYL